MVEHTGILEKWTNYWLGWQPRFFTLQSGILSYYQNEEEVNSGAKASIRVSSCDIILDNVDNRRFDVMVGSGQKFCLRAPSMSDRQTWLIALGTTKQAESDKRTVKNKKRADKFEKLQRKSTELRLYCDLLVQQVSGIEEANEEESGKLGENSAMLTATCKTFLKTLKEAMSLFDEKLKEEKEREKVTGFFTPSISPARSRAGSTGKLKRTPSTSSLPIGLSAPQEGSPKLSDKKGHNRQASTASTGSIEFSVRSPVYPDSRSLHSFHGAINESDIEPILNCQPKDNFEDELPVDIINDNLLEDQIRTVESVETVIDEFVDTEENLETGFPEIESELPEMFFTKMKHSFVSVELVRENDEMEIPTDSFLLASGDFLPILDKLGSKAFSPVKMDINGNIRKIRLKYETNPDQFPTLQSIIRSEQKANTTTVANSATDAIMWLKRGLSFVHRFLQNVGEGETNLTLALQNAYTSTLAKHHGWVVRGVFALAVKAAPYYDDFIQALGSDDVDINSQIFKDQLFQSLSEYTNSLNRHLTILDSFYQKHNLESNKLV